jgi:hypothetical protein
MPAKRKKIPPLVPTYWFGDVVFLKVESDRKPGIVTGVWFHESGRSGCAVTWSDCMSDHFDYELTDTFIPDYVGELGDREDGE